MKKFLSESKLMHLKSKKTYKEFDSAEGKVNKGFKYEEEVSVDSTPVSPSRMDTNKFTNLKV